MNIEVKSINEVLIMKCNEKIPFQDIMNDLEALLDQPIFQQDGYFPRAFFDFGCRQLENNELKNLIDILKSKKKILFEGLSIPHSYQHIEIKKDQVHNGDEVYIYHETLFLGMINIGSYVYCYHDVYFLNEVKGIIIAMNSDVKIYGHHFSHAQIIINRKVLQDVTTSAFTSIYYKDNEIVCIEEDGYDKNHCFDFR